MRNSEMLAKYNMNILIVHFLNHGRIIEKSQINYFKKSRNFHILLETILKYARKNKKTNAVVEIKVNHK